MTDLDEAFEQYFTARSEYRKDLWQRRRRILRNTRLTDAERMRKIANLNKGKCMKCEKRKGVRFTQNGNFLTATCLNDQCDFEIRIDRGRYKPISTLIRETKQSNDNDVETIIRSKLDLVFGLTTEDQVVNDLNPMKAKLVASSKKLRKLEEEYLEINTEEKVAPLLESGKGELATAVAALAEVANGDYDSKAKRMVNLQIDDVYPVASKLRDLSYASSRVECVESDTAFGRTCTLEQEVATYADNLIPVRKPSVLKLIV